MITTPARSTVVGLFEHRDQAARAVEALHAAGFRDDRVGLVVRKGDVSEDAPLPEGDTGTKMEEAAAGGAVAGTAVGVLGALATLLIPGVGPVAAAGVLAATLGGAATGAVAGGLLGAFIGMGIPEDEARIFEREVLSGRTLVTVQAEGRHAEAVGVLRQHGAYDTSAPTLAAGTAQLP